MADEPQNQNVQQPKEAAPAEGDGFAPEEPLSLEKRVAVAVADFVNHPAHRAIKINTAVVKTLKEAEKGLNDEMLDERLAKAVDLVKARWESPEGEAERNEQARTLIEELLPRIKNAQSPAHEAVIVESELYEREKMTSRQTVTTAAIGMLERDLYTFRHAEKGSAEELIPNRKADEMTEKLQALRFESPGTDAIADYYERLILKHKALPTGEDTERLEALEQSERARKAQDNNNATQVQNIAPIVPPTASVAIDDLGGFIPSLPVRDAKAPPLGKLGTFTLV